MNKEKRNNAIQTLEAEIQRYHQSLVECSFADFSDSNREILERLTTIADLTTICQALRKGEENTVKIIGSFQYGSLLTSTMHALILAGLTWEEADDIRTFKIS